MTEQKNPVGWFDIPVVDMARAMKFYQDLFGLELVRHQMGEIDMAMFPHNLDATQASGTLVKHKLYSPSATQGVLIYFTSPSSDLDADLKKVEELGGKIVQPKKAIGEHGFIAIFLDCEGNRIALHSMS